MITTRPDPKGSKVKYAKLSDLKASSTYKRALIVGDSGSGKTSLIRTAITPFVCDFDNKGDDILSGITGCISKYQGAEGWERFRSDLADFRATGLPEGCATLCIDSITFAADAALAWAKQKNGNTGAQATQQDWGRAIDEIKTAIAALTTLNCHVIVTVHLAVEKDELLGTINWQPSIYGTKLPGQLPAYFNDVWHTKLTVKTTNAGPVAEYTLQLAPDMRLKFLKNSGRGSWNTTEVPNITELLKKLKENA